MVRKISHVKLNFPILLFNKIAQKSQHFQLIKSMIEDIS